MPRQPEHGPTPRKPRGPQKIRDGSGKKVFSAFLQESAIRCLQVLAEQEGVSPTSFLENVLLDLAMARKILNREHPVGSHRLMLQMVFDDIEGMEDDRRTLDELERTFHRGTRVKVPEYEELYEAAILPPSDQISAAQRKRYVDSTIRKCIKLAMKKRKPRLRLVRGRGGEDRGRRFAPEPSEVTATMVEVPADFASKHSSAPPSPAPRRSRRKR